MSKRVSTRKMPSSVKHIRTRGKRPASRLTAVTKSPLDKAAGFEVVWGQVQELFDAARPIVDRSFVYAIGEEDGPVKIGFAIDPVKRRRDMQTANPRPLRIEHVILGDRAVEHFLHEQWEHLALCQDRTRLVARPGVEWFHSDIRDELFPLLGEIAARQADYVRSRDYEVRMTDLEDIVRAAHPRPFEEIEAEQLATEAKARWERRMRERGLA